MEQGWRSGESAHLPPVCPGFNSRTRRHMWIEFVAGSCPCSGGFSPGSPVFLPPQKPTFQNSNSIGNARATSLSVEDCCVSTSLNKVHLFYFFFIYLMKPGMSSCHKFLFQTGLKPVTVECFVSKHPSQPSPFLMPSKLLILSMVKRNLIALLYIVGCVPESIFNYLSIDSQ